MIGQHSASLALHMIRAISSDLAEIESELA